MQKSKYLIIDSGEIEKLNISTEVCNLVVMPSINLAKAINTAEILVKRSGTICLVLIVNDLIRMGFIRVINSVVRVTTAEFITYVAEDAYPGCNWLKIAEDALNNQQKGLFAFNDGKWNGRIASFGMAKRSWFSQIYQGDLFFTEYSRHGADTELTDIALLQGQLAYSPESILIEVDYKKDSNYFYDEADHALLKRRRELGLSNLLGLKTP